MPDCSAKLALVVIELMEEIEFLKEEIQKLKSEPRVTNVTHNHYHYRYNGCQTSPWYVTSISGSTSDTTENVFYTNEASNSNSLGFLTLSVG